MSSPSKVSKLKVILKSRTKGKETLDETTIMPKPTNESGKCNGISINEDNFDLHNRLLHTFEGFIHQLDELVLSLRGEENLKSNEYIPELTSYQDICEKLRIEVLIAIDKLQLTSFGGASYNENNIEFLNKMNNLKYQLSDIKCQYHNAIKDFDFKQEHNF